MHRFEFQTSKSSSGVFCKTEDPMHRHDALYKASHLTIIDSRNPFCLTSDVTMGYIGPLTYRKQTNCKMFPHKSSLCKLHNLTWDDTFCRCIKSQQQKTHLVSRSYKKTKHDLYLNHLAMTISFVSSLLNNRNNKLCL